MSLTKNNWLKNHWKSLAWILAIVFIGVTGWFTQNRWLPHAEGLMAYIQNKDSDGEAEADTKAAPSVAPDTLTLSPMAWKNIGLVAGTVEPQDFIKVVSVPAMVVERPGRSQIEISAPMTGIVTQVYPLERESTQPGQPLFDLRLTHEEVVSSQIDFLSRLQGFDVINKELTRIRNIGAGVIPKKRIIEQEYKRDESQASLRALRQSLLLHGMSELQVANIEQTRKVLRNITVVAPSFAKNHEHTDIQHQYHVQSIDVNRGESVAAGDLLGVLADHCLLYVEGKAFEDDAKRLVQTSNQGKTVQVVPVSGAYDTDQVLNLDLQSVSDQIDMKSRALKFYLLLPNQLMDEENGSKNSFVAWKYRPGQRMEAKIPTTDLLKNKVVLPSDAVVIDGPNAFVFEQNGDNFDRIDVHVLYRDKDSVVLENDGQLVGSIVAMNGAHQMHLAMKNQSGGAIDPHAGHNH